MRKIQKISLQTRTFEIHHLEDKIYKITQIQNFFQKGVPNLKTYFRLHDVYLYESGCISRSYFRFSSHAKCEVETSYISDLRTIFQSFIISPGAVPKQCAEIKKKIDLNKKSEKFQSSDLSLGNDFLRGR